MPTPHINAPDGAFAPAVLMPGDPRRAERIANLLMPDAEKVSDVRGIGAYTGVYNGKPLSVMASGMGQPSLSIYATELFTHYGVKRIIRIGTCGGLSSKVTVGDVVIAIGAHSDSSVTNLIPGIGLSHTASWELLSAAVAAAEGETSVHVGPVVSRDKFYGNDPSEVQKLADLGTLGVEMETAALYMLAAQHDAQALTVLTVSDHLLDGSDDMSAEDRESRFQGALKLAVAAAHC
ncbi:purine-nucleoside phosphorylase [Flaviflexus equikiangi]|uniref:Uridine phosphorylase n=1 Tax=Flaviflexus equikiangi TaxID=2758573 RepID=A0ABS2TDS9_9ACTO|nr:purine-nucleoside phosphorylase [Flaviflexus equikiangi]MBM9432792.1 purine-nucleoside phosphorylase [Flaviflexus equikiangi]